MTNEQMYGQMDALTKSSVKKFISKCLFLQKLCQGFEQLLTTKTHE